MSDGITDSYRDQERTERYEDFLKILALYIENQTLDNLNKLKSTAESVDDVPRGLMTGQTNLSQGLDVMLAGLVVGDQRIWGKLLLSAVNSYPYATYKKLKSLSPFVGKVLVEVNYGCGFVTLGGEMQAVLNKIIGIENNLKIYDADKYIVAIPESALAQIEVNWLHCGYFGVKEPRKQRIG